MLHIPIKLDAIVRSFRQKFAASAARTQETLPQEELPQMLPFPIDEIPGIRAPGVKVDGSAASFMDAPTIRREALKLGTHLPEGAAAFWLVSMPSPVTPMSAPIGNLTSSGECELLNQLLARRKAG